MQNKLNVNNMDSELDFFFTQDFSRNILACFIYTLYQDILDSQFALLLDIYKYFMVQMMFIQNYEQFPRFLC